MAKSKKQKRRELKELTEREISEYFGDEKKALSTVDLVTRQTVGNYTIIQVFQGDLMGIGISKYNPHDEKLGYPYSQERGLQIALGRACADIAKQVYP